MDLSRRRVRGVQPRRYDDYDGPRPRASLAVANAHLANRTAPRLPTRVLPDISGNNGFQELGRNEIKRDMRESEKNNAMSCSTADLDHEDFDNNRRLLTQLNRPPCAAGSTLQRKKHRYLAWVADDDARKGDLESYRKTLHFVENEVELLNSDTDEWRHAMDVCRASLRTSIAAAKRQNKLLSMQTDVLVEQTINEMGRNARKRKSSAIGVDAADELIDRKDILMNKLEAFDKIVKDAINIEGSSSSSGYKVPVVHISFDKNELKQSQASEVIKKIIKKDEKNTHNDNTDTDTNTNTNGENEVKDEEISTLNARNSESVAPKTGKTIGTAESGNASASTTAPIEEEVEEVVTVRETRRATAERADDNDNDEDEIRDVASFLVDDKIKLAESLLGDIEVFFEDDEENTSNAVKDADTYVNLRNRNDWVGYLDQALGNIGTVNTVPNAAVKRKRRGGLTSIPLTAPVLPRAPRGIPLLISPLSHYGDRYLGAVYSDQRVDVKDYKGKRSSAKNILSSSSSSALSHAKLPRSVSNLENETTTRCGIISSSVSAADTLRRTVHQGNEWRKLVHDSQITLDKLDNNFQIVLAEALAERREATKKLVHAGMLKLKADDPPLSPLPRTSVPSSAIVKKVEKVKKKLARETAKLASDGLIDIIPPPTASHDTKDDNGASSVATKTTRAATKKRRSKAQMQAAFSGPPGWRMVDRFYGFRYELEGTDLFDSDLEEAIVKKADEMGCFGWIQKTDKGSYVGEVRCAKQRGPIFQEWLRTYNNVIAAAHFKVYEDTKIRLHFSTFTILPEDRDTCFLDKPHECTDLVLDEEKQERIRKGMNPGPTLDHFEL